MQQFVAYLSETKHIVRIPFLQPFAFPQHLTDVTYQSISIAKLHKLCIPFCSLAFNILNSEGENDTNTPS
jgi:hypothetical protein